MDIQLKQTIQSLEEEKNSRVTELEELHEIEQALCDILHATPLYIPKDVIPSLDQLDQLRKHTQQLTTVKVRYLHLYWPFLCLVT